MAAKTVELCRAKKWLEAVEAREATGDFIAQCGANFNPYDVRIMTSYDWTPIGKYLNQNDVRAALHVDNRTWATGSGPVYEHLKADVMQSTKNLFPDLLAHYRVMLYQGQFDTQDGVPASEVWIDTIDWPGRDNYLKTNRTVWRNPTTKAVAGFATQYGPLSEVVVLAAGHLVPMDQPENSLDLIRRFVRNVPFGSPETSELTPTPHARGGRDAL